MTTAISSKISPDPFYKKNAWHLITSIFTLTEPGEEKNVKNQETQHCQIQSNDSNPIHFEEHEKSSSMEILVDEKRPTKNCNKKLMATKNKYHLYQSILLK